MMQLPELNAFKDIPGYKAILKAVIKSQIQFLVSFIETWVQVLVSSVSERSFGIGSNFSYNTSMQSIGYLGQVFIFCTKTGLT